MSNPCEFESFIRVYDQAVSREFCKGIIDYFEWCSQNNKTWERPDGNNSKEDVSVSLNPINFWEIDFTFHNLTGYINEFNNSFWNVCSKGN
jgi:hypothetical protein